jgi:hypothetical protein
LLKKLEKMAQKQKEETEKDEGTVSEDKPYVSSPVTPRRAKRSVPDTPNRRNRNFSGKNHQTQSESPDPPEPPTPAAKPATGQTIPTRLEKFAQNWDQDKLEALDFPKKHSRVTLNFIKKGEYTDERNRAAHETNGRLAHWILRGMNQDMIHFYEDAFLYVYGMSLKEAEAIYTLKAL